MSFILLLYDQKFVTNYNIVDILFLPADNYSLRDPYDKILRCLGFRVRLIFLCLHQLVTEVDFHIFQQRTTV